MEIFRRLDASGRLRAYGPPLTALENFQQKVADASKQAFCNFMQTYGPSLQYATPLLLGSRTAPGAASALAITLADWAAKNNCDFDSDVPPGDDNRVCGCTEVKEKFNRTLMLRYPTGRLEASRREGWKIAASYYTDVPTFEFPGGDPSRPGLAVRLLCDECVGQPEAETYYFEDQGNGIPNCVFLDAGANECVGDGNGPDTTPPLLEPITIEVDQNCSMTLNLKAIGANPDGSGGPIWDVRPSQELREGGGGLISGCNFSPVVYYDDGGSGGDGGGGGPTIPIPPDFPESDDPDYLDKLKDLLLSGLGTAAGNLLASTLKDLFEAKLPSASFTFVAPCDKQPDGNPQAVVYELPEQDYQSRVVSQQAVLMEIMQQHLNWKTPTCNEVPEPKGDYRTISFISDERTTAGDRYLSKRFRYRSESGIGLSGLVDHWKDFEWDAGPVCVKHTGYSWGAPQVWAATVDEGKRVIQHAGREAGIDPNQVGQWSVSGSDNPRFGLPGRMRVNTKGGYYWITERLGSSGRPVVASR